MKYMSEKREDAIELFINEFSIITDCLYDSELNTTKADKYYNSLLLVKGFLEDIYFEEE